MPNIALARQGKIYRNISNALGRTKYISQYIGCIQEAQIRMNILVYIPTHHSELEKKEKNSRLK